MSATLNRLSIILAPTNIVVLLVIVALIAKPFAESSRASDLLQHASFHHVHHAVDGGALDHDHLVSEITDATSKPHKHNFKDGFKPSQHRHCHSHAGTHVGGEPIFNLYFEISMHGLDFSRRLEPYYEYHLIASSSVKSALFRPPILA